MNIHLLGFNCPHFPPKTLTTLSLFSGTLFSGPKYQIYLKKKKSITCPLLLLFKVSSMPYMEFELRTPRSRAPCFTNWDSQSLHKPILLDLSNQSSLQHYIIMCVSLITSFFFSILIPLYFRLISLVLVYIPVNGFCCYQMLEFWLYI